MRLTHTPKNIKKVFFMHQAYYTNQNSNNLHSNSGLLIEHKVGSFQPGDILAIWFNGVRHYGIYVGGGSIIDNSRRDGGVAKVSLARFKAGREIDNLGHTGPFSREKVIDRAFARIGHKWDILGSNCESFYRGCQGRSEISYQVYVGLLMAGVFAVGISRR